MCVAHAWPKRNALRSGLPDGLFTNQKSKFGKILDGLAMEDVGIFHGHFFQFTVFSHIFDIWYSLW
jgi:hypothetical protein